MKDKTKISSDNKSKKIILVVVAHTDDETIGMGGTISRHSENGDKVYGLSMTDGVGARLQKDKKSIKLREKASINAGKILGLDWLEPGKFPDNSMDSVSLLDIVRLIEKAKTKVNPDIIYTHSAADLNIDHRVVSQAILTAFRPQTDENWQEIRTFEVASATDYGHKSVTNNFYPNLYIDITNTWKNKLAALNGYAMELKSAPHSRSLDGIENLAKYRGNQVGLCHAEAFEIIKKILR